MLKVEKVKNKPVWKVSLDKRVVGEIRFLIGTEERFGVDEPVTFFQYFPKGSSTGGEKYKDLTACMKSLETDNG